MENSTTEKTKYIVCKSLSVNGIDKNIDLFEEGLLDSLAMMQLMVELEEGFDITINPEELEVEDYRTITSISEMVERLR